MLMGDIVHLCQQFIRENAFVANKRMREKYFDFVACI